MGQAAPIVNEATSVCGPRDGTFIRKCQRRRDACGRQLNDPQYTRLKTQGTKKMKGKTTDVKNKRTEQSLLSSL